MIATKPKKKGHKAGLAKKRPVKKRPVKPVEAMPAAILRRPQAWPLILDTFIEAKRHVPFAWGVNDCCLFVCDWLWTLMGIDPAEALGLRGKYGDAKGALRVLKARGGVEAIAAEGCEAMGWPNVAPGLARRGDVVCVEGDHGAALGVCLGALVACAGPVGVVFKPVRDCTAAWRVG